MALGKQGEDRAHQCCEGSKQEVGWSPVGRPLQTELPVILQVILALCSQGQFLLLSTQSS